MLFFMIESSRRPDAINFPDDASFHLFYYIAFLREKQMFTLTFILGIPEDFYPSRLFSVRFLSRRPFSFSIVRHDASSRLSSRQK